MLSKKESIQNYESKLKNYSEVSTMNRLSNPDYETMSTIIGRDDSFLKKDNYNHNSPDEGDNRH